MIAETIEHVANVMHGTTVGGDYNDRHLVTAWNILTIHNEREAFRVVLSIHSEIIGKRVVEIGAGVGFLSLEMAKLAKSVIAFEANPSWSWVFSKLLYRLKPPNLTWIFGHSDSVPVVADVAVICTRSGVPEMLASARKIAPLIILLLCEEPLICEANDPRLDEMASFCEKLKDELVNEVAGSTP